MIQTTMWKSSVCAVLAVKFFLCLSSVNGNSLPCSEERLGFSARSSFRKVVLRGSPLTYRGKNPLLINHPCKEYFSNGHAPAIYLGEKVFITVDGFESSLLPLTISKRLVAAPAVVTAAVFLHYSRLLLVINGKVYVYIYKRLGSWRLSLGISKPVTHITNIECCYDVTDPNCYETAKTVIAYNSEDPAYYNNIFFSNNGGYQFIMITFAGYEIGVYNFVSLSQLALLISNTKNNRKSPYFMFGGRAYMESRRDSSFCLEPCDKKSVVSLIPSGLRGFMLLWTNDSFMFSFNNGLTVQPVTVHRTDNYYEKSLPLNGKGLCNVAAAKNEIAILTPNLLLFYGTLGIVSTQMVYIGYDSHCEVLMFENTGMLSILRPVSSNESQFYNFHKCIVNIQDTLMQLRPPLRPCPVQIFSGNFNNKMFYIDMKQELEFNVTFVPKPGTGAFPFVTVSNPHVLAFKAQLVQAGYTYDGNTKYNLHIVLLQQQFSSMAHPEFQDNIYQGRLSTVSVDIYNKGIFCIDMHPLTALVAVDCPPTKQIRLYKNSTACSKGLFHKYTLQNHFTYVIKRNMYDPTFQGRKVLVQEDLNVTYNYSLLKCPILLYYDSPWLPVLELWENDKFVEYVSADFVLIEIHGIHTYDYLLSETDANCISRPQNWNSSLKNDITNEPKNAWNRYNYKSCKEPRGNYSLPSNSRKYQVLNINEKNRILFQQYNGIYVFQVTVVDTLYSYCDLTTVFSVYVHGAIPKSEINPGKTLTSFLVLIFGSTLIVYYFPKLMKENAKMKSIWT